MLRIIFVFVFIGAYEYQKCWGDTIPSDDWRKRGFYRPRRNYPSQSQVDHSSHGHGHGQNLQNQNAFGSTLAQSSTGTTYSHNLFGINSQNSQRRDYRTSENHSFGVGSQNFKASDSFRTSFGQNQGQSSFGASYQNSQSQHTLTRNSPSQDTFGSQDSLNSRYSQTAGSQSRMSNQNVFGRYNQNIQNQNSVENIYSQKSQQSFGTFHQNVQNQNSFGNNFQSLNTFPLQNKTSNHFSSNFDSNFASTNNQNYKPPGYLPPKRYMAPEYLPPYQPRTTTFPPYVPFKTTTTSRRPFYTTTTTRIPFYTTTTTKRPFYTTTTTRRPLYTTSTTKRPFYTTTRRPICSTTTTNRTLPPADDDDHKINPDKMKPGIVSPAMAVPVPPEPDDDGDEIFPDFSRTTKKPEMGNPEPAPAMAMPVPPEPDDDGDEIIPDFSRTTKKPEMVNPVYLPAMAMRVPPEPDDDGDEIVPDFSRTTKKPEMVNPEYAPAMAMRVPPEEDDPSTTTTTTTTTTLSTTISTTPTTTTSTTTPPTTTSTTPTTTTSTTTPPTTTSTTPTTTTSTTIPSTTSSTTQPTTTTSTTLSTTTSTAQPTTTSTTPTTTTTTTTMTPPPFTSSTTPDPNRSLIEEESSPTTQTTTETIPPTTTTSTTTTSTTTPSTITPPTTTPPTTTLTTTTQTTTCVCPSTTVVPSDPIITPPYLPPIKDDKGVPPVLPTIVPPEPDCDPLDPSTYPSEIDQRYFGDNPCAPSMQTTVKPPFRGPLYLPPLPETRVRRSANNTLNLEDLKGTPRPVWYAGIYRKTTNPYLPICGGSIIREDVVISAAHCFWDDVNGKQPAELFAVATSKIYKPWNDPMDKKAQKSDVSDIKIPPRFLGAKTSFQEDLAILKLVAPFKYTRGVKPICIDFDDDFDRQQMKAGHQGTIAGWGYTDAKGTVTQRLLWLELPYVEIEKCIRDSEDSFLKYITCDKVCAGENDTGKALCRGDSGGGLAFWAGTPTHATPYLRGIASTAPAQRGAECNVFAYASFTHVRAHRTFLRTHVPGVEECRFWE